MTPAIRSRDKEGTKGRKTRGFQLSEEKNWLALARSTKLSSRHILCFPASHAGCGKKVVWGLSIFPHQNLNLPNNMFGAEATRREQRKQLLRDRGCWKPPAWKRASTHFLIFYSCEKTFIATGTLGWHILWLVSWTKRVRESTSSLTLNMAIKSCILSRKTWLKQK